MELHDALSQIGEIRRQMARSAVFRGYRAVPVAFSGILAFMVAALQSSWPPLATREPSGYFTVWILAAVLSLAAIGFELIWRLRHAESPLEGQQTLHALGQLLPSLLVGAALLLVLAEVAPEQMWMLPGWWAILLGLGILASRPYMPPALVWSGAFYLGAGVLCLVWARGDLAYTPWAMGLPFGIGQLLVATLLYCTLERNDGEA